jgi:hypothetical protein
MIQVSLEAAALPPGLRCAKREIWQIKIEGDCACGVCIELPESRDRQGRKEDSIVAGAITRNA